MKIQAATAMALAAFFLGAWAAGRVERQVYVVETRRTPPFVPDVLGVGEYVYLQAPETLLDGIRRAEGQPSYGVLTLGARWGGHEHVPEWQGREMAAAIVHRVYRRWVFRGRGGDFIVALRDAYCGPQLACPYWLRNVLSAIPDEILGRAARRLVTEEAIPPSAGP